MRRARATGLPVLLEGQGADELRAGYPQCAAIEAVTVLGQLARGEIMAADARAMLAGFRRTFGGRWLSL